MVVCFPISAPDLELSGGMDDTYSSLIPVPFTGLGLELVNERTSKWKENYGLLETSTHPGDSLRLKRQYFIVERA